MHSLSAITSAEGGLYLGMRKKTRVAPRLKLSTQTIRALQVVALAQAAGGVSGITYGCDTTSVIRDITRSMCTRC
jgi:hypothetical protein